jgi:hypothetical protein
VITLLEVVILSCFGVQDIDVSKCGSKDGGIISVIDFQSGGIEVGRKEQSKEQNNKGKSND